MPVSLRQKFIVDELRAAAIEKNEMKLKVIREIIDRIKKIQLKYKCVASDDMVLESLSGYLADHLVELEFLKGLIHEASDDRGE